MAKKNSRSNTAENNVQQSSNISVASVTSEKTTVNKEAISVDSSIKTLYVSDVVDFKTEIKPYHIVLLVAGVGAGKTHFLGDLAKSGKMVLEITSRRSIADEQRVDLDAIKHIKDIDYLKGTNKICVLTNAQVEKYMKYQYRRGAEDTYFWNAFDVICLDEVHSLVSDASFSDSSFYLQHFFRIATQTAKHANFIFMTGTPEPVEYLFKKGNSDLYGDFKYNTFNRIDLFEKCNHVMPKRVQPIEKRGALWLLRDMLLKGNKIIYFARTITNLKAIKEGLETSGIEEKLIGIDFSDKEEFSSLKKKDQERQNRIRKSLLKGELPEDICLFLTTTKNKEGINIKNTDIHYMFAESNMQCELRQMSGRLRANDVFECLFIVYDETWGKPMAQNLFKMYTERSIFDNGLFMYTISKFYAGVYSDLCELKNYYAPTLTAEDIEKNLYMIRFNPGTASAKWYNAREHSIKLNIVDSFNLHLYIKYWNEPLWFYKKDVDDKGIELDTETLVCSLFPDYFDGFDEFLKRISFDKALTKSLILDAAPAPDSSTKMLTGKDCLQLWFPNSEIYEPLIVEKDEKTLFAHHFVALLDKLDIKVNDDNKADKYLALLDGLNDLLNFFDYKELGFASHPMKSLNPALKRVGMSVEYENGKRLHGKLVLEVLENPFAKLDDDSAVEKYVDKVLEAKDGIYSVEV